MAIFKGVNFVFLVTYVRNLITKGINKIIAFRSTVGKLAFKHLLVIVESLILSKSPSVQQHLAASSMYGLGWLCVITAG